MDPLEAGCSLRRVFSLLRRLPAGALPDETVSGAAAWSTEAHLLATLSDQVAYLTYVTARAAGAKGAHKPKPMRRPRQRPGTPVAEPQTADHANGNGRKVKWSQLGDALSGMRGMVSRDG